MADFSRLRYFSPDEPGFPFPEKMDQRLMNRLDTARHLAGTPFVISSSFRTTSGTSHGRGTGVDIRCTVSRRRWKILNGLFLAGFTRIGIYDAHIHADVDQKNGSPNYVAWWGQSR